MPAKVNPNTRITPPEPVVSQSPGIEYSELRAENARESFWSRSVAAARGRSGRDRRLWATRKPMSPGQEGWTTRPPRSV